MIMDIVTMNLQSLAVAAISAKQKNVTHPHTDVPTKVTFQGHRMRF